MEVNGEKPVFFDLLSVIHILMPKKTLLKTCEFLFTNYKPPTSRQLY